MTVTDQMGRRVTLRVPATRIVSVVPSQTELLAHLGLEDSVAGITKFCVHPARWHRDKTRVGGTKKLDLEKIRALAPDLILANKEENTQQDLEALMEDFPVWISDIRCLAQATEMIGHVGVLTGRVPEARETARQVTEGFERLSAGTPRLLPVAYFIWRDPWMVAGGDTFIDDMLFRAGFQNCFGSLSRYPVIGPSTAAGAVMLLSSEPYPFREQHAAELRERVPGCEIRFVDGEMFSWYGSRLLQAPGYFRELRRGLGRL
jgi:ABC-type Fe3+-hydroxamate transport system substrate-binding protein